MKTLRGSDQIVDDFKKAVVTIGNFDGVHLGHRRIINDVVQRARQEGGTSVVFTFRPHPHMALKPDAAVELIMTYDEKLEALEKLGVDVVLEQPFSREFSTITPDRFFNEVLLKKLSTKALYVGYDFGFGKGRAGNLDVLRSFCEQNGLDLHVAKPLEIEGSICSSSRIRELLKSGDIAGANQRLGQEFFYRGIVTKGDGRGRTIGFPTANVSPGNKILVKPGVYATRVVSGGKVYDAVTNVGYRPTFIDAGKNGKPPVAIETHIFEFHKDIYGEQLEVRFLERIRDEMKFSSPAALVEQIKKDAQHARAVKSRA